MRRIRTFPSPRSVAYSAEAAPAAKAGRLRREAYPAWRCTPLALLLAASPRLLCGAAASGAGVPASSGSPGVEVVLLDIAKPPNGGNLRKGVPLRFEWQGLVLTLAAQAGGKLSVAKVARTDYRAKPLRVSLFGPREGNLTFDLEPGDEVDFSCVDRLRAVGRGRRLVLEVHAGEPDFFLEVRRAGSELKVVGGKRRLWVPEGGRLDVEDLAGGMLKVEQSKGGGSGQSTTLYDCESSDDPLSARLCAGFFVPAGEEMTEFAAGTYVGFRMERRSWRRWGRQVQAEVNFMRAKPTAAGAVSSLLLVEGGLVQPIGGPGTSSWYCGTKLGWMEEFMSPENERALSLSFEAGTYLFGGRAGLRARYAFLLGSDNVRGVVMLGVSGVF